MNENPNPEKRVKFDFEIDFSNGGGIQGQDFRLDLVGDDITDAALAEYIVTDLRLLMVKEVRIIKKELLTENHKRKIKTLGARARHRLIDVSHTVEHGMITYKGLPAPLICDFLSREESRSRYSEGTEFQIGKIEMVANTGTYVDSPFHRYAEGKDLSELPLASLADLDGIIVRSTGRALNRTAFGGREIKGKAVLVHTGWDRHWRTDQYFEDHPFLTEDAAQYLAEEGAAMVGIDSFNIDDVTDGRRPVHSILLGANIPIVEHLRGLAQLPDSGFRFFAVPVKVKHFGTFPVRAFGMIAQNG
ncbi:MAG: cyclase family protein [bacterium]